MKKLILSAALLASTLTFAPPEINWNWDWDFDQSSYTPIYTLPKST